MENLKNIPEQTEKKEFTILINQEHKLFLFKAINSDNRLVGVAELELKSKKGKSKHYHLKSINSFLKGYGVAKNILKEIGRFIDKENATASGIVWGRRKLKLFTDNGWQALESTKSHQNSDKITIAYKK